MVKTNGTMKHNLNNNLLLEVKRINEIMGVNYDLIIESVIPTQVLVKFSDLIKEFGDDFFSYVKKGDSLVDDIVQRTGSKVVNLTTDEVAILLKKLTTGGTTALAKKIFQTDTVFNVSTRNLVLGQMVKNIVNNTANYQKATKQIADAEKTFFNLFNDKNPMPDYLSQLSREYRKLFKAELDNIIKTKHPETWKVIIKGIKGLRANESNILASLSRGTKEFISAIANGTSLDEIQSWIRINLRVFKDARTLQDEFNRLASDAEEKINRSVMPDYELKKMADVLAATKKTFDDAPIYTYEEWVTNNKDFPERIKRELDRIPNRFNDLYQEMMKKSTVWEAMNTETAAFKSMFKIFSFNKTNRILIFRTGPEAKEAWQRLGMYILVMDPRFPKEWLRALILRGVKRDLAITLVFRFIEHAVIWPAFASFLKTTMAASVSLAEWFTNKLPWIKEDVDWIEYNESRSNEDFNIWWSEVKREFLLRIPQNAVECIDSATQITASDDALELGRKLYDKWLRYLFRGAGENELPEFDYSDVDEVLRMRNQQFQDFLNSQPDNVRSWWIQQRQRFINSQSTSENETTTIPTNQTGPRSDQSIEVNPDDLPD